MQKISVSGDRLVDEQGRHVILNGINLINKGNLEGGKMNYISPWDETVFNNFKAWGFNVIRLGLIWDAVEPEPGQYDEDYLDWIGKMLDQCEKHGIFAYLDMHQDLFSVLYCDGAPEWATLTDDKPHIDGDLWSDAYLLSEAVQRAFDNFWANAPATDGIGLQDHYVAMWVHIAKRFSHHPAVIGYDFLNEPFPGSSATTIFGTLMGELTEKMNQITGTQYTLEEMIGIFSNQEEKLEVLAFLDNQEIYMGIAKAVEPLLEVFDKGTLDAFYRKVSQAIRTIDKNSIIMRENSYFSNMGIECKAYPIAYENGEREPMQAFSPHGYDLGVDTQAMQYASNDRIDVIFDAHRRTQQSMDVPVLVGEWGAHGNYPGGLSHLEHILTIFENYLWSNTYWCYNENFHKAPALAILKRPYPQAVCGEILSYGYDRKSRKFHMTWDEGEGTVPTIIYLPTKNFTLDLMNNYTVEPMADSALLVIEPIGNQRNITISL